MTPWTLSLLLPLGIVYLLTEHPALCGGSFFGFSSNEILTIHTLLWILTTVLSLLFARSRAGLLGFIALLFSVALPNAQLADYDPLTLSLAYFASSLCLLVAPEKNILRINSLIWLGLAAVFGLGSLTVGEMYGHTYTNYFVFISTCLWGGITLTLKHKTHEPRGNSVLSESLLLSSLAGTAFAGWTLSLGPEALSGTGFRTLCLLAALPSLVSVIEHSFRLAYIDELTEILGRRALVEALQDEDGTFTLAMLDVDHFKKFNDTHGHELGDQVLRMVAARLSTVGEGGTVYRFGGEEFTLVFLGKSPDEVAEELERLRALIEQSTMVLRAEGRPKKKPKRSSKSKNKKPSVHVTISIGSTSRQGTENWEQVMKRADIALYRAKEEGRNRVCQA